MVISIRNTDSVRFWEVVRFSEGPLSEVRLYMYIAEEYYFLMYYTGMGEVQRQTKRTAN